MSNQSPCLHCADRFPGCHSTCQKEDYLEREEKLSKIRKGRSAYRRSKVIANLEAYLSAKEGKK